MQPRSKALRGCRSLGIAAAMAIAVSVASSATLESGAVRLSIAAGGVAELIRPEAAGSAIWAEQPLGLQLLTAAHETAWLEGRYGSVSAAGSTLRCSGTVQTPAGSVFEFSDVFQSGPEAGTVLLRRQVSVQRAARGDVGFLTRFGVAAAQPQPLRAYELFVPGIAYGDNRGLPAYALAADLSESDLITREDRMPLPLVMLRNKSDGTALVLVHCHPSGATTVADYTAARVVNPAIRVASLGIRDAQANAAVAFLFPGSEGQRSYLRSRRSGRTRSIPTGWVERFHPVQSGTRQAYTLLIGVSQQPDFPRAMRWAWRLAYEHTPPPTAKVDVPATYAASIKLIADWSRPTAGAHGVPFRLRLPEGKLEDPEKVSYQMGFVGQQIPLAYHLLRHGLQQGDETIVQKGEATMNFWATNSLTPEGLPRVWYNTWPKPRWRDRNTFLRDASDGMGGAIMAYDVMARAGRIRPAWLAFCQGFGDWLLAHQNPDGSWFREYRIDGTVANMGKQNTYQPIRFLIDLAKITDDRRYLAAALRAGEWAWTNTHLAFCYVGGTVDNPNVTDKEAGFLALEAFLALHDATGETRWLQAAQQAADFTETWAYCWNVPIPSDDPKATYPRGATTTGFSLIACGHSGADLFLAGAPFFYYRLYLQTGDRHYAKVARQFLYDTRQSVDIDGSLGYGHPGLCTEALSLAPPRGHGVNTWLPWLSYSMMEPVVRLQEAYGTMDTPLLDDRERQEWLRKDRQFGANRGLMVVERKAPR